MRRIPVVVVLLIAGCSRDGGGSGVCHEAADLCSASDDFDEDDCTGDQKAYAECIVDRGDCEPQTAVDCAQGGGGGDGGVTGGGSIELTVTSFAWELSLVDVTLEITNVGEDQPIAVAPSFFQVEDEAANLHIASGGICNGGELLAAGGSEQCDLQFTIGAAAPVKLLYADGQGRGADASLEGLCSSQPESTEAACSDGCSNDDDDFVDCDDYDCCDVVDCPSSSECGQQQECVAGPENTAESCSDGCSNDADSYVDCEDFDCCDVVACPPGTACGDG
jgi:hypothetical protein